MLQPLFIYADYLPAAAVTATDTATGYAAADVLQAHEDSSWKPANITGAKSLTFDLSTALSRGAIAVAGEYLNGVTFEVRASTDNFATSDVQISAPAAISSYTTSYRLFANSIYRYWRLIFTDMGASTEIYHVAIQKQDLLPWHENDPAPEAYKTEGSHLVSPDGHYLGATQTRTMRNLELDFGLILDAEYVIFQRWADSCVKTLRGFFYVPDSSQAACHFGWADAKYVFKAPYKNGMRDLAAIPFVSRVI